MMILVFKNSFLCLQCLINPYYLHFKFFIMANKSEKTVNGEEMNVEFWNEKYEYLMDACEGLKMSYAILMDLARHAREQREKLDPSYKIDE